jgi:hypothetical protein
LGPQAQGGSPFDISEYYRQTILLAYFLAFHSVTRYDPAADTEMNRISGRAHRTVPSPGTAVEEKVVS